MLAVPRGGAAAGGARAHGAAAAEWIAKHAADFADIGQAQPR